MSDSSAAKWRSEIRADLLGGLRKPLSTRGASQAAGVTASDLATKTIPPAEGRPALCLPDDAPLRDLALPPFLKPGLTVSYNAGDSLHKRFEDPALDYRQRYGSVGGLGYINANVNFATPELVTFDVRTYFIADTTRLRALSSTTTAVVGDKVSAGVYWVHPTLLARLCQDGAPPQPDDVQVRLLQYETKTGRFDAVRISRQVGGGGRKRDHEREDDLERDDPEGGELARAVYDLETGLLLAQSQVTNTGMSSTSSQCEYVGRREQRIPWANQPPPDWVAHTRALKYEGANTISLGTAVVRQAVTLSLELEQLHPHVLLAKVISRTDQGAAFLPQQVGWDMACAPAMVYPLWISPASLREMQAGQVVDEDPITRFRMTFKGIEGDRAVVIEQGPLEHNTYFFDARRGILLGIRAQRPYAEGAGQLLMETWLREQP